MSLRPVTPRIKAGSSERGDGEVIGAPELSSMARQLRKEATDAEHLLWQFLRARRLGGMKFRRQHALGSFIADFYCHESRLIVELDGSVHADREEHDRDRDEWLKLQGLTVLRFSNTEVFLNLEATLTSILHHTPPSPFGRRGLGG